MYEENNVRFDVDGEELRKHCQVKAEYHLGRAKFYEEQVKVFKDEAEEIARKNENMYSNTTALSNKERMEASMKHHADKVRFFKFAADHLKATAYKITRVEAKDFEMIP